MGETTTAPVDIKTATAMLRDISNRMARFEPVDQAEIDALSEAVAGVAVGWSGPARRYDFCRQRPRTSSSEVQS